VTGHETFTIAAKDAGKRLDQILAAALPDCSRARAQKLIEAGAVQIDGRAAGKSGRPAEGAQVMVLLPEAQEPKAVAQAIPLDIRYEDGDLLAVNKPRGMVVHPAPGNPDATLVNALLYHCKGNLSGINGVLRPGILHRIDKDTSGLLLVAKNDFAHNALALQIQQHSLLREYRGVVYGNMKQPSGMVNAPIGRSQKDRKKMCVTTEHAREAVTNYEVLREYSGFSYLKLRLETGRTHQIRVHMAYLGHPVAGDPVYGPKKDTTGLNGQCLHAGLLGFQHPRSGERLRVEAELPDYFQAFLERLGGIL